MDEDTEKLVITSADGRTNQRCLGVRGPPAPLTRAASRSGPHASGPALTGDVKRVCPLLHLFLPEPVQIASWPKLHTQRSNLAKLTHESTIVHCRLGTHIYTFCVCVCVCALRGMQDVSSQPGIEPVPPAMDVQSANHWTTGEVPTCTSF